MIDNYSVIDVGRLWDFGLTGANSCRHRTKVQQTAAMVANGLTYDPSSHCFPVPMCAGGCFSSEAAQSVAGHHRSSSEDSVQESAAGTGDASGKVKQSNKWNRTIAGRRPEMRGGSVRVRSWDPLR